MEVNEGGWCNINVARAFFDLGPDDSNYLFGFGEIGKEMRKVRTPKGWAKRARQFIIDEMTPAPTAQ